MASWRPQGPATSSTRFSSLVKSVASDQQQPKVRPSPPATREPVGELVDEEEESEEDEEEL